MELSEFEQMDIGLARVAAAQQLGLMISRKTGQEIAEVEVVNGRWRCYVPGRGWFLASDLLLDAKVLPTEPRDDSMGAGERPGIGAGIRKQEPTRIGTRAATLPSSLWKQSRPSGNSRAVPAG